ncbi:MAG TPA: D-alanine--D-alanine ligase [Clostridia bacterium]|jgi:D-alanine-D-alanine ligase|nr:D-alanine--D-alanine ligase [Clostridia bacterium]
MREKIAVLLGGKSAEREVSLKTGEAIFKALINNGYRAEKIDTAENFIQQLEKGNYDLAFLALHGRYGEDGTIQGLLETIGMPYTGSGVLSSAICMNKIITKKLLRAEGIPTAKFCSFSLSDYKRQGSAVLEQQILKELNMPFVVKPANEGSTIGLTVVNRPTQLKEGLELAFLHDNQVIAEEFIKGVEVTAGIIGNSDPLVLPLVEIVPKKGIYDYESKYTKGMTEYIVPARLPQDFYESAQQVARKAYLALGCRGAARIDLIVAGDGTPFVLEANTIPGMTETSLLPKAAKAAGIEFDALIEQMVRLALENTELYK